MKKSVKFVTKHRVPIEMAEDKENYARELGNKIGEVIARTVQAQEEITDLEFIVMVEIV